MSANTTVINAEEGLALIKSLMSASNAAAAPAVNTSPSDSSVTTATPNATTAADTPEPPEEVMSTPGLNLDFLNQAVATTTKGANEAEPVAEEAAGDMGVTMGQNITISMPSIHAEISGPIPGVQISVQSPQITISVPMELLMKLLGMLGQLGQQQPSK